MTSLYLSIFIVIILVGFFILIYYVKKAKADIQKNIARRYSSQNIVMREDSANFFGKESLKYNQIRGNGTLILTQDEICFSLFVPKKEIIVPLDSIQDVETPTSFLGKTKFRPLLKISFNPSQEVQDSAAWLVRDVEKWKKEIQKRIKNHRKRFAHYES